MPTGATDGNAIGFVEAFLRRLERQHKDFTGNSLRVFWDSKDIENDDHFTQVIRRGVRDSVLFLAFLSPKYVASEWCRREWEEYLRYQHPNARGDDGIKQVYVVSVPELDARDDPSVGDAQAEFVRYLRGLNRGSDVDVRDVSYDARDLIEALAQEDATGRLDALKERLRSQIGALDESIQKRLDKVRLAEIADKFTNLPAGYETFVGRHRELVALHDAVTRSRFGLVGAVHGFGGQGKTALAVQYAHAYAGFFASGGRWFLPCEGIGKLVDAFDLLPAIAGYDLSPEDRVLEPVARLRRHVQRLEQLMDHRLVELRALWAASRGKEAERDFISRRALIVLDNVDRPDFLSEAALANLPERSDWLSLVATTRLDPAALGSRSQIATIPVDELPMADRVALVREYRDVPTADETQLRELLEIVGGITVLVDVAGASLRADARRFPNETLADTLRRRIERLRAYGFQELDRMGDRVANDIRAAERTRRLAFVVEDTLESLGAVAEGAARHVLACATFFPPDQIPEAWLRRMAVIEAPGLDDDDIWADLLTILDGRRILLRGTSGEEVGALRLHRDIAQVLAMALPADRKDMLRRQADYALYAVIEELDEWRHPPELAIWRPALSAWANHLSSVRPSVATALALNLVSRTEGSVGLLSVAIALGDRALRQMSDLSTADPDDERLRRSLSIIQTNVAELLTRRGVVGDPERALDLYQAALATLEEILEANPGAVDAARDVSVSQDRLSLFYQSRGGSGDPERALSLYLASHATREAILKANPSSVDAARDLTVSQYSLGDFYRVRGGSGDAERALDLFQASLAAREAILKANPDSVESARDVSLTQGMLGNVFQERGGSGDAERALDLYRASHTTLEAILKANPGSAAAARDVSVSQDVLGAFYQARGGFGDAERALDLYQASLATLEAILKANPGSAAAARDVSVSQVKLGDFYRARGGSGDAELALDLYWAAHAAREEIMKANLLSAAAASDVSLSQDRLGDCYLARGGPGDVERALDLYKSSLATREAILKANPGSAAAARDVSVSQNSLGAFYHARGGSGDEERAMNLYKASLAMAELILKANPGSAVASRDVSVYQNCLADFYQARGGSGDAERAWNLYQASLAVAELIHGANRSSMTGLVYVGFHHWKLAWLGEELGDPTAANQHFRRAYNLLDGAVEAGRPMDPTLRQVWEWLRDRFDPLDAEGA
ncbi:MAG: TIR domain-containing protein [Cypionkella sp.]